VGIWSDSERNIPNQGYCIYTGASGRIEKYFNGKLHCSNGPAIIDEYTKIWYSHGKRHRLDGPAYASGEHHEFNICDIWIKDEDKFWFYAKHFNSMKFIRATLNDESTIEFLDPKVEIEFKLRFG